MTVFEETLAGLPVWYLPAAVLLLAVLAVVLAVARRRDDDQAGSVQGQAYGVDDDDRTAQWLAAMHDDTDGETVATVDPQDTGGWWLAELAEGGPLDTRLHAAFDLFEARLAETLGSQWLPLVRDAEMVDRSFRQLVEATSRDTAEWPTLAGAAS